jgi:cytochrome P450
VLKASALYGGGVNLSIGFPLIGRVHDIPAQAAWVKFHEWSKEFGPIYQHEMFGSVHVWISSERIAHDLLSKRSLIYSDRPLIPNLADNRTSGNYLALLGRNGMWMIERSIILPHVHTDEVADTWKRQRKLCQHLMSTSAADSLHSYPTLERDRFLYLTSQDSSNYIEWIEQFTSRTICRLSWGSTHPAATLRKTTFGLLETISPAGALPNVISWLAHVPHSLSPWKQKEKTRQVLEGKLFKGNFEYVRRMMIAKTASPSFARTFLGSKLSSDHEEQTRWGEESEATHVVGLMAIAGALTIGSPIQSYLLAMCHYPRWQCALQDHIDTALDGRCPQWEDREKLPLLRAVVKEVIRWRPPVPTGTSAAQRVNHNMEANPRRNPTCGGEG